MATRINAASLRVLRISDPLHTSPIYFSTNPATFVNVARVNQNVQWPQCTHIKDQLLWTTKAATKVYYLVFFAGELINCIHQSRLTSNRTPHFPQKVSQTILISSCRRAGFSTSLMRNNMFPLTLLYQLCHKVTRPCDNLEPPLDFPSLFFATTVFMKCVHDWF